MRRGSGFSSQALGLALTAAYFARVVRCAAASALRSGCRSGLHGSGCHFGNNDRSLGNRRDGGRFHRSSFHYRFGHDGRSGVELFDCRGDLGWRLLGYRRLLRLSQGFLGGHGQGGGDCYGGAFGGCGGSTFGASLGCVCVVLGVIGDRVAIGIAQALTAVAAAT